MNKAPVTPSRLAKADVLARLALAALLVLVLVGAADSVLAQTSPFGGPRPPPQPATAGGFFGWILARQAEFYQQFSGLVRAAKTDGSAAWGLFGVAFLYGVLHAAGPGHGKAVISSYLVANEETWRRGVILSFASAILQAIVAIAIVGIGAALLGATSRLMCRTADIIEMVSYGLIAALGLWLLWVKGRGLVNALQSLPARRPAAVGADVARRHDRDHDHHHDHHHHDHEDSHGHVHDKSCGHLHGPEPAELAGPGGWRRGLSAIVAVGLRPCSGAIVLLVFALAQGVFWIGVGATFLMALGTALTVALIATFAVGARSLATKLAATRSGYGIVFLRGIEVAAAALVLAFGALLLAGYMLTERLTFC
jgi:nickel/cobalt exporter